MKLKTKIDGGRCLPLTDSAFRVCRNPENMGQLLDVEKRCESQKEKVLYMKGAAQTSDSAVASQETPGMMVVSDHD